jgi:hypothetical protein
MPKKRAKKVPTKIVPKNGTCTWRNFLAQLCLFSYFGTFCLSQMALSAFFSLFSLL